MVDATEQGKALFSISVAAELTGVKPQTLRSYEDKGLVTPARTDGGTRRYSNHDINRINDITSLLSDGLNLTGIAHVLALRAETSALRDQLHRAQHRSTTDNPTPRNQHNSTGRSKPTT